MLTEEKRREGEVSPARRKDTKTSRQYTDADTGPQTFNAERLTRALGGRWRGRHGICRCPAHDDREPSLSLADGAGGRLLARCFAGCDFGAVLAALRGLGLLGAPALPLVRRPRPKPAVLDDAARTAAALRIWREAQDPRGTLVERYLAGRGLALDLDLAGRVLRYHPRLWHADSRTAWPAMLGLMSSLGSGQPRAVHRTFLLPDGSGKAPVTPDRKMLGPSADAAVQLDPSEDVALGLCVAEGIESALAARAMGFRPCWAVGSAGGIERLPVLGGVEALTVLGEVDASGTNARAVQACARRWVAAVRDVSVIDPDAGDLNDVWLARVRA